MSDIHFRSEVFGTDARPCGIASMVAGYDGEIKDFTYGIETLNGFGYDVVAYNYPNDVLRSGEPEYLVNLVMDIKTDFQDKAEPYKNRRHCGVSLGVSIAYNLQRSETKQTLAGLYAATGTRLPELVMRNWFLREDCAKFRANYDEDTLEQAWKAIEIVPEHPPEVPTPAVVALGALDFIAKRRDAMEIVRAWRKAGIPIKTVTRPFGHHTSTIKWYNNNLDKMLKLSKRIYPVTVP